MSARAKKPSGTTKPPPIPQRDSEAKTTISKRPKPPTKPKPIMQAISMKTPGHRIAADEMRAEPEPALKRPKLRAMSEITPVENPQLGYLAPPVDPRHQRARRARDITVVVSLSIILASIVALVIWFLAR